ncbi:Tyrosine--tRNA ligase [Pyrenophora tritici-repentis]|uniref:Tyrosine--tRNA ligase n=2 Tax=Pyrenophora tritici-repentis TaxID=45151 RepID=A0A316ZS96_9PLEO|nr:Tyrosine--tRNA ligase [Pyrenophora tritici-repentis]KAI1667332.1 Tyrosine--tRNA ligase [Pyrenophora tritici-repentis]KAI1679528.1 Tyrosine--tRNA ligase [Pyrenophora tritici-repentis]
MSALRHWSRSRQVIGRQCIRLQHTLARGERPELRWAEEEQDPEVRRARWEEQAGKVRTGMQQSMLSLLEERGFVKDIAGGRKTLDWLLTEKRIGVYVGVDPTAPSLHVGHLLPLMALYWMYLHGYYAVSLLGGGTVQIGDPSGRTTARSRQGEDVQSMNVRSINEQLKTLWTNVKCLGIKHQYSYNISRKQSILNNRNWLEKLNAVELMRDLGSGMRLGAMLSRDSVKLRMESGEGMSISEFSYPLFQAYDWWSMYKDRGVQLQIGGSDQYGNIIAGMGAVSHMQKIHGLNGGAEEEDPKEAPYGLTTPLLTTASGEKFGKSAGNAVWLDGQMLKPFDLYQYFLRTADADVERYLKLFTFLPLDSIALLMTSQNRDPSKRIAQHALAQEIVELAHGAAEAKKVAMAHKDAFGQGTNTFSLFTLRNAISSTKTAETPTKASAKQISEAEKNLLAYKKAFAASASAITPPDQETPTSPADTNTNKTVITLPLSLLQPGSFPTVLHAAGLAASKSEASRLIASKGAYVLVPNSGSPETPTALRWETIKPTKDCDPNHYLVDFEALVLRSGKSKIQICRVVRDDGAVDGGMEDEVEIHRKS